MAHKIEAINALRPRIQQGNTVQKAELIRRLSHATSLVEGSVSMTLSELRFCILEYCLSGRAVKVEGMGTWFPSMSLDGRISIQYRPDLGFDYEINKPGAFTGNVRNKENIGKTSDQLVTEWLEQNPGEQVV